MSTFDGFTGSRKNSLTLKEAGLKGKRLDCFAAGGELDGAGIANLLDILKENSRAVTPKKLGVIGEEHLRVRFEEIGEDDDQFRYKRVDGTQDGTSGRDGTVLA